ncbi:MAG: hypothetical protein JNM36_04170 [Chitinophagales bacterium]|nr:hypothetical protein [Chitinophagales bacterium]
MRYITLFFCVYLLCSCDNGVPYSGKNNANSTNFDNILISDFHLERQYNNARWLLYMVSYGDSCTSWNIKDSTIDTTSLSTTKIEAFPIIFDTIWIDGDTVAMKLRIGIDKDNYCQFISSKESKVHSRMFEEIAFSRQYPDSIYYVLKDGLFHKGLFAFKSSNYNKILSIFSNYLQHNKNSIHPWLRQEAQRRGILK